MLVNLFRILGSIDEFISVFVYVYNFVFPEFPWDGSTLGSKKGLLCLSGDSGWGLREEGQF